MVSINPILKCHLENFDSGLDVDQIDVSGDIEELDVLSNVGNYVDGAERDLSGVENAERMISQVHEVQKSNLSTVEQNIILTTVDGNPTEVPLEEMPEMIDAQIVSESFVMESAATSLGLMSQLGSSSMSQLYDKLKISNKKPTTEANTSKKSYSISKYKSHCEGFGAVLGKLGKLVWDGIVKLIRAIKEWILKFFNLKKDALKYCAHVYNKIKSLPDDKITLIQSTINAVSGPAILIGLQDKDIPFENSYDLFEAITGSVNDLDKFTAKYGERVDDGLFSLMVMAVVTGKFNVVGSTIARRFEGLKKRPFTFNDKIANVTCKGGTGYYLGNNNSYGIVVGKSNDTREALIRFFESDITSLKIEFGSGAEVRDEIIEIIRSFTANFKLYDRLSKDADRFMKMIDEGKFVKIDPTGSEESQMFARRVIAEYVKGTKNIICLPNVYISAIKMLMGCIKF